MDSEYQKGVVVMQKVGCSNCEYGWKAFRDGLKPCPDAFTEVSQYCNLYDKRNMEDWCGNTRTETADKRE